MVIDKSVLRIVTNRKDVLVLYLADGTLNDVPEHAKYKTRNKLKKKSFKENITSVQELVPSAQIDIYLSRD